MPTFNADPSALSLGLLLARLVLGPLMAAHGAQKLLGWFGGYGLTGTGEFFAQLGFRPGRAFALAASVGEVVSGILVTFGLLGPIGPALMLSIMIVAAVTVHWEHGVFATQNGIEVPLLYSTGAVALAITGFGSFSLDAVLGLSVGLPATLVVLTAGALGAVANLSLRAGAPQAAERR
jgi:putative oxidoreductase